MFETPILFLIFNRPDLTTQVFERIREIKPKYLYIAADGPRETHPDDKTKCELTRKVVIDAIDWDCELKTLFREKNLGCGLAVSQAITWFFEQIEMGIILEDDTLPSISFFSFSEWVLQEFKDNHQVMAINGSNFQLGRKRGTGDFYLSNYFNSWGWATWRNKWNLYDFEIQINKQNIEKIVRIFSNNKEFDYWISLFEDAEKIDTWDYQWHFTILINSGLIIVPNKNLVINLGIGNEYTHTKAFSPFYRQIKLQDLNKPYKKPKGMEVNKAADYFTFIKFHRCYPSIINIIRNIAYKLIPDRVYFYLKLIFNRV